jgi:DNA polymerase I
VPTSPLPCPNGEGRNHRPSPTKLLVTKTVQTTEDLKRLVTDYEQFDAFAFDVETKGERKVRMLRVPGPLPKGPTRTARTSVPCPSCGREFADSRRKFCSDICSKAAAKDKPPLDARTNTVWSLSLAGPGRSDVIPMGHPDPRPQLYRAEVFEILAPLFFSRRRKINQNVSFDLLSVAKYYDGEIPPPPYGDTLILSFLLNENLDNYKLGYLSKKYLAYPTRLDSNLSTAYGDEKLGEEAYRVGFHEAMRYSIIDAKMAWLLWWKLSHRLESLPKLAALFDLEMAVMGVLMAMRQHGAYVDVEAFGPLRETLERQRADKEAECYGIVGREINLNSPKQLAEYLYDELKLRCPKLTTKGARSTDADTLKSLAHRHPFPAKLLEQRDVQKMLTTYIGGYIPSIDDDSRIRASFNQAVAKTGRLSCSGPNLQNIPARYRQNTEGTMVRRLFRAPPGYRLIVADYSQIELRILAHQTRDKTLLYAYTEGIDLHLMTASRIWKIPPEQVTAEQRSIAKNSNFNFAFEGGPGRVVQMSGVSLRDAEAVYDAWHAAYPGVKKWGKEVKRFCWQHGFVETLYGRKRRLPEITSDDWKLRGYAERQAVNHPIQGTAADIAKIAIVRVHEALQGIRAHLVLQVHDEFVIECYEGDIDEALPLVRAAMEDIRRGNRPVLDVPLEANISVGSNWAECK